MATHEPAQPFVMPQRVTRSWIEESRFFVSALRSPVILDFTHTTTIESAGIAGIRVFQRKCKKSGISLQFINVSPQLQTLLSVHDTAGEHRFGSAGQPRTSRLIRLGDFLIRTKQQAIEALSVLVEILYWASIGLAKRRNFRKGVFEEQMYQLGYKAILIVVLLAFLIGVVLSLQSAMQLKRFGAEIYLVGMVTISMLREIGPLMTAIILAGRSGSATTAEIATMAVQEEIDALRTMGINHYQFIIVPKLWAISVTMPLLSIMAVGAGIFGGLIVSLVYLDISPYLFWNEFTENLAFIDFLAGFLKSIVFSWLIIWIGAFYGLRVRGGAEEVGRETTASVVTCLFAIIVTDALFSFVI
ncbi:MAG: MlaE family lipid ABC transporter permease subunit [Chitinivibrionales bacterium]|nr:MlaE family lipid ABC transporter permease subunit [Chitinivibrionales bacterium]